jgi:hypothetical protein
MRTVALYPQNLHGPVARHAKRSFLSVKREPLDRGKLIS